MAMVGWPFLFVVMLPIWWRVSLLCHSQAKRFHLFMCACVFVMHLFPCIVVSCERGVLLAVLS